MNVRRESQEIICYYIKPIEQMSDEGQNFTMNTGFNTWLQWIRQRQLQDETRDI